MEIAVFVGGHRDLDDLRVHRRQLRVSLADLTLGRYQVLPGVGQRLGRLIIELDGPVLLGSQLVEPVPDLADRRPRRRPRGPGGGDQGRHREQRGDDSPCAGRQGTDGRRTPTHRYDTLLHPARLTVTTPPRQCGTAGTDGNTYLSWVTAAWTKAVWVPVAVNSDSEQHLLSAGDAGRGHAFD